MENGKGKVWRRVRLGEVLKRSGQTIPIQPDREYREITVKLWGKGVVLRGVVDGASISSANRYLAKAGRLIFSRIDARNGAIGIVPEELDGAVVTNDFPLFDLNPERADAGFVAWLSKTRDFVELCLRASEGTTNRVRLKEERFLALEIALPPLTEQQRIVARIEALAAEIHEARSLRQSAVDQVETLYHSALGKIMDPHGSAWTRETVNNVIISMDAGWSPQCEDIPAGDDMWGVLKTTAVQWCEFRPQENKALPMTLRPMPELAVREGDVLVTRAGPRKRVGVVAAVRQSHPTLTISDKLIRLRPNRDKVEPRFLEHSLASPYSQEHLVYRKTGLADAQVNISQAILRATPIAYPALPEQRRIVAELNALQAEVDTLKRHQADTAAELDALLPAVLDRAFRGEL